MNPFDIALGEAMLTITNLQARITNLAVEKATLEEKVAELTKKPEEKTDGV